MRTESELKFVGKNACVLNTHWLVVMMMQVAIPGFAKLTLHAMDPYDGQDVSRLAVAAGGASSGGLILLTLDLARAPSMAGRGCYFALRASVTSLASGIALMIDRGDGQLSIVSSDSDVSSAAWATHSTQATLLSSGVARFAVKLFGANASALVSSPVVAPIGLHMNEAEE
jgi:hypothetical protein